MTNRGTVVGIDPSLTGTGIAVLENEDSIKTYLIESTGRKTASLKDRYERLSTIVSQVESIIEKADPSLTVIEGPAFSSKMGSAHDRSGLWWMFVNMLMNRSEHVIEIPPTTRCKYITGNGRASKDEVVARAVKKYPQAEIYNNNIADAVGLLAIGARKLDIPIEKEYVTKECLEALKKIDWRGLENG